MPEDFEFNSSIEDLKLDSPLKLWSGVASGPVATPMSVNEVKLMAMIMCPVSDIAAFYGFSERQLYRRFAKDPELKQAFDTGRAQGRRMLRQKQFTVAVKEGDVNMLKWLGQNVLGQSSRHSVVSDDLNTARFSDAIDAEFSEVFSEIDAELEADGYELTEQSGESGKPPVEPDNK